MRSSSSSKVQCQTSPPIKRLHGVEIFRNYGQLFKKFPASYETWMFLTVFTGPCHGLPLWHNATNPKIKEVKFNDRYESPWGGSNANFQNVVCIANVLQTVGIAFELPLPE
jgi:hypothetical protein